MKKLFLLLALFGVLSVSCDSFNDILTPNDNNGNKDANHTFITDSEGDYVVDAEGGEIVVAITTDIEYDVVIPTDAQSWLSVADTRAETRMEKLKFIIAPNSGTEERSAMVELVDNDYNTLETISITQTVKTQASANKEIWYTTTDGNTLLPYDSDASVFGAILVSNTYSNGRGVLVFDDEVTSIGDNAFTNCRTLASITIPESVTYIGRESFGGCSNLTSITIPSSVTLIDRLAFAHCEKLKKVIFKNGFTGIIMGSAFMDCNSLEEFTFPSNTVVVEPIVDRCKRLETIYIPNTVRKIVAYALAENESLKNIYFDGTKAQWKAIEKSHYWSYGMGDYTVYCADGKISEKKKKKTNPTIEEKAVVEEAAEYIYCDVKFENTPRKFSYITDDDSIVVGDTVVVPTGRNNIESIGVVCNIQRCTSKNAPYPPTKTKRILRKFII